MVDGEEVVQNIESIPVNEMSRPIQDVKIVNCGELVLKSKRNYFKNRYRFRVPRNVDINFSIDFRQGKQTSYSLERFFGQRQKIQKGIEA